MFKENELGFEFKNSKIIVFFGKKEATLEKIKVQYSDYIFLTIKQTHSDICIPARSLNENIEADAHYTGQPQEALVIRTADCLPIMIYSSKNKSVLAIHAGWRGIENQITLKSLKQLYWNDHLDIFIGPHILKSSFEVEGDVKNRLLENVVGDKQSYFEKKENKYFISLNKILLDLLKEKKYQFNLHSLNLDTYQSSIFNSFRTNQSPDRNISFIALL
jgi:polyphenol oxidase